MIYHHSEMKADWRLSIVVEVMTQTVQMALTVIVHYWADWVRRGSNSYRMLARPAESVDSCQSGERGRGGDLGSFEGFELSSTRW